MGVAAAEEGVEREELAVEPAGPPAPQAGLIVEREEQPELQAAAPTQLNPLAVKAVRAEILRPNLPPARARTVSIPRDQEWDRGAPARA